MSHTSSSPNHAPEILRETINSPWLSSIALIVSNLVPLWGVLFHGWDIFVVLILFWMENVVIGVFNVLRMLTARPAGPLGVLQALFMAAFFAVHYGIFTLVHGAMIVFMFGGSTFGHLPQYPARPFGLANLLYSVLAERLPIGLLIALGGLVASHTISFVVNFIGKGEYRNVDLNALMSAPYGRIVVLHLTLLFGGFAVIGLHAGHYVVVILVILKIAMDLGAHWKERNRFARPPAVQKGPAKAAL